jgi:hypothetical protein
MRTLALTTLLTLTACQPASAEITRVWLTVEIKSLDGKVLDRKEFGAGERK